MKTQVTLSKEQFKLFQAGALIVTLENGDKYYHLPLFYKQIDEDTFECIKRKDLPDEIESVINPYDL